MGALFTDFCFETKSVKEAQDRGSAAVRPASGSSTGDECGGRERPDDGEQTTDDRKQRSDPQRSEPQRIKDEWRTADNREGAGG